MIEIFQYIIFSVCMCYPLCAAYNVKMLEMWYRTFTYLQIYFIDCFQEMGHSNGLALWLFFFMDGSKLSSSVGGCYYHCFLKVLQEFLLCGITLNMNSDLDFCFMVQNFQHVLRAVKKKKITFQTYFLYHSQSSGKIEAKQIVTLGTKYI